MTKYLISLLLFTLSLAYGQLNGVFPENDAVVDADWLIVGLVLLYFLFLFVVYKRARSEALRDSRSRQRDEVEHELIEKK